MQFVHLPTPIARELLVPEECVVFAPRKPVYPSQRGAVPCAMGAAAASGEGGESLTHSLVLALSAGSLSSPRLSSCEADWRV